MVPVNLKSLVSKLNDTCRRALEAAAGLCLSRTNYNVEVEHWLMKLLEAPNTDLTVLMRQFGVDASRVQRDLTKAIDRFKTGNSRPPSLSPNIPDLAREAWVLCSIEYGGYRTRSGHVLAALLSDENMARLAKEASGEFSKINAESLRKDLMALVANSSESEGDMGTMPSGPAAPGQAGPAGPSKTPNLDQFTTDLTARARAGKIDPVLGRDAEIRQVVDILTRRRQNNPILTGEAGVGKTAVAEGFALRIAAGDVPPPLQKVMLKSLDLSALQAGAGVKGEFENRLKAVLEEVKSSPQPIILFIDEAHQLIGAGGSAGQGDAANMLKPALARGELRTIAATTWAEYKKYFERDAALARRFQVVKVDEPSEAVAIEMMRGLIGMMEKHHGVQVLDEAVRDAVKLSHRFLSGRQLPDKSVSLIDTACARVNLSQSTIPPAIEDATRQIERCNTTIGVLEREEMTGPSHKERLDELRQQKTKAEEDLAALKKRWEEEKKLVEQIRKLHGQLHGAGDGKSKDAAAAASLKPGEPPQPPPAPLSAADREKIRTESDRLTAQLVQVQGEEPLVKVSVDGQAVAEVLSNWTGIPAGRMQRDEIEAVRTLKQRLQERIVGQDHALEAIAERVRMARANLTDPRKPIGVFMLVGTSGVGKTETAIALADLLYGGEQNMTVINMSEFKEEHKVSLLMGSPPGYVGYGEGGVLTEAVRRRPYSVLLLDEMEKAHPGVQDVFYQVFDKGHMKDGEGRDIDFKNTLILMTSNAGTDTIVKVCADPDTMPDSEGLYTALRPDLEKYFKPAFLGRIVSVPYFPLSDTVMKQIIELKLGSVRKRVKENYKATFTWTPELVNTIASRCTEAASGARNVDNILSRTLLPEMAGEFLNRMGEGQPISSVNVTVNGDGKFKYEIK